MLFVSNHDMNAWEGTEFEQFGDMLEAAVVLSVASDGMPLIYNGQEAGNDKRLQFFEKDLIEWREHPMGDLYRRLVALKNANRALWNGCWGARMIEIRTTDRPSVLAFVRDAGDDAVVGLFNLTENERAVTLAEGPFGGSYVDFTTGEQVTLQPGDSVELAAWGYRLLVRGAGSRV
jgi:glycosidase